MADILRLLKANMNDPLWIRAVSEYVASFDDVEAAALKYVATLGDVDDGPLTAIKAHYQTSIAEYLTNPASFGRALFVPIDRTLSAAVTTGAPLDNTSKALRDHIKGVGDMRGGVERTAQGAADTTITIYERSATQTIADQVGVELFMYQGRNIDTTREFCRKRAGHVWSRKEIEAWADEEWSGKVEGTDAQTIFIYLGGWYGDQAACRHVLVPVNRRDAPAADLARIDGGIEFAKQPSVDDVMLKAKESAPDLDRIAGVIATKFGVQVTPTDLKSKGSILRKAKDDYNGDIDKVGDTVRNTIVSDHAKHGDILAELKGLSVFVRSKTRTADIDDLGYSGHVVNIRMKNGALGEIQVNTAKMTYAKEQGVNARRILGD